MGMKTGTKKSSDRFYDLNNEKDIAIIKKRCSQAIDVIPGHLPGRGDLKKEFFIYVYTLWIQEKRKGATIKQLSIDFLREKSGRIKDPRIVDQDKHLRSMELKKSLYYETFKKISSEGIPSKDKDIAEQLDIKRQYNEIVSPLDKYERMLLIMKHVYDFTYKEISIMMGMCEKSVHDTILDIHERVKVNYLESVHNEIIH